MTPAVDARPLRRRTFALLAASTAIVGAAALLHARAPSPKRASATTCGSEQTVGGMRIAVRPESCKILRGASTTHIAVEVTAPDGAKHDRAPIAMGLVIDRSGSMIDKTASHHPLRDAKDAARRAIEALRPEDSFSVVSYSTGVETLVSFGPATEARKAEARAAIESMRADGDTNISAGLETGAESLAYATDQLERIVLISDGQPNEGIYDREGLSALAGRLAARGVSISTVGVGLEFDERVMTQIAVAGRGNYYFVEESSDLGRIFDQELGSMGETVAVDAHLEVTPALGVDIVDAYGYRIDRNGATVRVPVADLRAGETRKVVLQVRVDARAAGAMELVSTRMSWREVGQHQGRFADAKVTVNVSDDATAVAASRDADASRGVQEAKMANALDQATEAYERGDVQQAQQILETQASAGKAAAREMNDGELEKKLEDVRATNSGGFAAPAKGDGRLRNTKSARKQAYDLAR
jgi:Ca-activated chloride channel family protein